MVGWISIFFFTVLGTVSGIVGYGPGFFFTSLILLDSVSGTVGLIHLVPIYLYRAMKVSV